MSVAVIIPASAHDDGDRLAARRWVAARYRALFPWLVHVSEHHGQPWCKAEAVNPTAAAVDADVLVIADADSFTTAEAMTDAVTAVQSGRAQWAIPATSVRRMDLAATKATLGSDPTTDRPGIQTGHSHQLLAGGGIVVVAQPLWSDVGGFDGRFVGWGGEDYALGCALRTLSGHYPHRVPGVLWHLWHPPAPSAAGLLSPPSAVLADRYRHAKFDPAAMRDLIDGKDG